MKNNTNNIIKNNLSKIFILVFFIIFSQSNIFASGMNDDPLLVKIMGDVKTSNTNEVSWNIKTWVGYDFNKLWLKTEGSLDNNKLEEQEIQLLYSRTIDVFWDVYIGAKIDLAQEESEKNLKWGVLAISGLAPYYIDIDASLFIGENSQNALNVELEFENMITQKLVLIPSLAFNIYSKDDEKLGFGKGLNNIEFDAKMKYEFTREFAPYIGFNINKQFGNLKKFTENKAIKENKEYENIQKTFIVGIDFWF